MRLNWTFTFLLRRIIDKQLFNDIIIKYAVGFKILKMIFASCVCVCVCVAARKVLLASVKDRHISCDFIHFVVCFFFSSDLLVYARMRACPIQNTGQDYICIELRMFEIFGYKFSIHAQIIRKERINNKKWILISAFL